MNDLQTIDSPSIGATETPAPENLLGQYIPLLYHYNMLQDADRMGAFRQAIDLVVRPGMHVVELGGGTGILSSFAARRGARVTCVERNPELVAASRRFVDLNGLSDHVTVVQADATEFVPETPVDAVICEMLHVGLLREKQASVIDAFKKNYKRRFETKSSAVGLPVFIPEVSILMVQPVQQCFDFDGYHAPVPMFQAPLQDQPGTIPLSALQPYASVAYHETIPQRFQIERQSAVENGGCLNAVRFVTQNVLTVDEAAQHAITWPNQCLVLPIDGPVDVSPGRLVDLRFDYHAGGDVDALQESLSVRAT